MSEKNRETIARWADLVFKIGTPVGLAALFFLKTSFVTRPELAAIESRMTQLESTIAVMVEQNRTNERQDQRIADHETWIRALEFVRR